MQRGDTVYLSATRHTAVVRSPRPCELCKEHLLSCHDIKHLSEKIDDGREGEQQTQTQQDQSNGVGTPRSDDFVSPAPIQKSPDAEPYKNGQSGYTGERPCRFLENEADLDGGRLVSGERQDCQSKGSDTRRENGRCAATVRQCRSVGRRNNIIRRIHFSSPRLR